MAKELTYQEIVEEMKKITRDGYLMTDEEISILVNKFVEEYYGNS